ncbi:MAG: BrnT family toxin [Rubrivivax sp.]|nr:BrnT family toxin [Rubrivivax sp.]
MGKWLNQTAATGRQPRPVVSVVHSESEDEIRVISFRKATRREAQLYFREVQD